MVKRFEMTVVLDDGESFTAEVPDESNARKMAFAWATEKGVWRPLGDGSSVYYPPSRIREVRMREAPTSGS